MRLSRSESSPNSWMGLKEQGKRYFENRDYERALSSYRTALNPVYEAPRTEQQIILSNIVACRLKIGGHAQAAAAVDDARKCVEINPNWSKGRVRLASAYIALGGHSNDACNELQTALRLDPGNSSARQMLMQELRRDHRAASQAQTEQGGLEEETNSFRDPTRHSFRTSPQNSNYSDSTAGPSNIDDRFSWADRFRFHWSRLSIWYQSQPHDMRTAIKLLMVFLLLYVAFGGRFGLEYTSHSQRSSGNYNHGNAYDEFYGRRRQTSFASADSYRGSSSYGSYSFSPFSSATRTVNSRRTFRSGLFDASLPSMFLLFGMGYALHRAGVNPMHLLWVVNMGRGRFGGFHFGAPYYHRRVRRW